MNITDVRVTLHSHDNGQGRLKAFASISFDDCFVVRSLRVIRGDNGYFVAMPSRKKPNGEMVDIAHPITEKFRLEITKKVLNAYEEELKKDR